MNSKKKSISPEEIDRQISNIAFGGRFCRARRCDGTFSILLLKEISLTDKIWMDFIYKEALAEGKEKEILPMSELSVFLEENGVWTKENEKEIDGLKIAIEELESNLSSEEVTNTDKQRVRKLRNIMNERLGAAERAKAEHFSSCLEKYAEGEKIRSMAFCLTNTIDGHKYWPTWEDFEQETDGVLISSLITEIARTEYVDVPTIRAVARSPLWRFKWAAAKDTGDLFGKPLVYLTRNQESLIYWSQVYDAAYEAYERPSEDIIKDDEALDKWFEEQHRKRKVEEILDAKNKSKSAISSNIARHGEIAIAPKSKEDIENIYNLNSPMGKRFLAQQNKKLKQSGIMSEQELRSDKDSRRMIGAKDTVYSIRRGQDGFAKRYVDKQFPGGTLEGK